MAPNSPLPMSGQVAPGEDSNPLPEYDRPPVSETVLGVEFHPLKGWDVTHFGLFWDLVKGDFPVVRVKPPLGGDLEPQADGTLLLQLAVVDVPEVRCWFMEETETRLIQVQQGRFIHNWKKVAGDEVYPRYEATIRPAFQREWERFTGFLQENDLGQPAIRRCEVTYINHLVKGHEWNDELDLASMFRFWTRDPEGAFLTAPGIGNLSFRYSLPGDAGTLHVSIAPAIRSADGKEILQFNLSAKGSPDQGDIAMMEWFDLAREWIVRGFTDLTTPQLHEVWERTR